jgi:TonB family protein
MLEVNDHIFGSPREMLCVGLALAIHIPLYFWKAMPDAGPMGDPIAEIEFKIDQAETETPAPPPKEEKKEEVSFFKKMTQAVGLSTPKPMDKLIVPDKPKTDLLGTQTPNAIQASRRIPENVQQQGRLVDKDRSLAGTFDVGKIQPKAGGGLSGVGLGAGDKVGGGGTINQKSPGVRFAKGDLPFALNKGPAGELANADPDAPQIVLSNRTDKRAKSVSTAFFGTGGGTGGGDGSGEGGGGTLKSKEGGRPLMGVSGGFSTIGAPGTDSGAGGGDALMGSPGGKGRGAGAGGGSRVPYEISGPLSGRRILFQTLPVFPDWAREKGLIATVGIRFYVLHTGEVNANKTIVDRSSGYQKLDELARQALLQWRFQELDPAQYGKEQWGIITFKFKAL